MCVISAYIGLSPFPAPPLSPPSLAIYNSEDKDPVSSLAQQ